MATYAPDGGLYVPEKLPMITFDQLQAWSKFKYHEICAEIVHIFTGIDISSLRDMTNKAVRNNVDRMLQHYTNCAL